MFKHSLVLLVSLSISGCVGVRQEDLDSWVGQPVALLDAHPLFMTVPLETRKSADGIEIRNYRNGKTINSCSSNTYVYGNASYANTYASCYENDVVCNNIFYIKNNTVLRYEPVGQCFTDERVQPRRMY